MRFRRLGLIVSLLTFTSCSSGSAPAEDVDSNQVSSTDTNAPTATEPEDQNVSEVAAAKLTAGDRQRICRAMVADMDGYSPSIVKVVSERHQIVRVRYNRPTDGKQWTTDCRFDGNRVVWRTVDAFGAGSGVGRWRDNPVDETIIYSLEGNKVTITTNYSDGSGGSETYTLR